MASLNKVLLMGNLTRDPELRYTPKGTAVADIGMALNRFRSSDSGERTEEVTYVDVTLWGRQAELANQYLSKGRGVFIEGRLQMDTWEDKNTGQKRSKLKVVGENMQFLPGSGGSGGGGGGGHQGSSSGDFGHRDRNDGGGAHSGGEAGSAGGGQFAQGKPSNNQFEEEDDIPF